MRVKTCKWKKCKHLVPRRGLGYCKPHRKHEPIGKAMRQLYTAPIFDEIIEPNLFLKLHDYFSTVKQPGGVLVQVSTA